MRTLPDTDPALHELLHLVQQGDQQAFSQLVDKYWQTIYSHALAYLHSTQSAEELTQDVFVQVWKIRAQLTTIEDFPAYLFIMARNAIISAMRKKIGDRLNHVADPPDIISDGDLNHIESKELQQVLMKGIAQLAPRRRQVFEMSRLQGKTHAQIAAELQISKDTVSEYIVLALQFLREWLARHYGKTTVILILMAIQ
jgi:RNA polymerase sigma-70 factor (ECF subfamily)